MYCTFVTSNTPELKEDMLEFNAVGYIFFPTQEAVSYFYACGYILDLQKEKLHINSILIEKMMYC